MHFYKKVLDCEDLQHLASNILPNVCNYKRIEVASYEKGLESSQTNEVFPARKGITRMIYATAFISAVE